MSMIAEVNAYRLDPDVFIEAIELCQKVDLLCAGLEATQVDFDQYVRSVYPAVFAGGASDAEAPLAVMAIHFRRSALSDFLGRAEAEGFASQIADGRGGFINEQMAICAADEPLLDQEGPMCFDFESFRRRVLRAIRPAGRA